MDGRCLDSSRGCQIPPDRRATQRRCKDIFTIRDERLGLPVGVQLRQRSDMLRRVVVTATVWGVIAASGGLARADEDVAKGEIVFKKCMICHRIGEGAKNLVGPVLNGVVGRQAGTYEGYSYSALNKASGEN